MGISSQIYRSDLDKLVSQKAAEEQRKRANDLKSDMNHMQHNPFAHLGTRQTSQRPARLSHSQQTEPPKGHGTGQWPHYDPFGKQGAGAPIRDDHGNIVTVLSKVLTEAEEPQKAAATKAYVEELNKNAEQQRWNRYLEKEYARAPANDFASMVQEGKVGKPKRDPVTGLLLPHPMAFSDVSRHLYPSVRPDPKLQTDLDRVAMERAMTREMERHEMQQTDERSIEDGFGRPGAGAPNGDGNKKRKLDKVLFNANSERNDYFKTKEVVEPIATDMIPPVLQPPAGGAITQDVGPNGDSTRLNYVRNNVNSKHTNLYEYFQPKHPLQSKSPRDPFVKIAQYRLNAPFATPD